ncbi:MAG TPA: primosomal protein N' [Gammaproteobacteria bacterium]|nr:primosomal protein N' [Gammaproteobacteria bacterium]
MASPTTHDAAHGRRPGAAPSILRVAVDVPLNRYFDYLAPAGGPRLKPGVRVRVPFGRRRTVGVLVGTRAQSDIGAERLKPVIEALDAAPIIEAELLKFLRWAAEYYRHPPGEVFAAALPVLLRQGRPLYDPIEIWRPTPRGRQADPGDLARRAPRQAALLAALRAHPAGLDHGDLDELGAGWREPLAALEEKGLARREEVVSRPVPKSGDARGPEPTLTPAQASIVAAATANPNRFTSLLLHGATGSGKTEVYLRIIDKMLARGRQALVLVPEISLTPQLVERFQARFREPLAVLHSALSDSQRLSGWRAARDGSARIVIGTRSAVFTPLASPGVIVVDEEHDSSYKQQEGFRYSARDLAVVRAQRHGIPVVLGSATPSLETLYNAQRGRYVKCVLPERAGTAEHPSITLIDLRRHAARQGLSTPLLHAVRRHLDSGGQVMLYLNRRGYAPVWFCPGCGRAASCTRCDARMTVHAARRARLRCHHCGSERAPEAACADCGTAMKPVGQGTERVEEVLAEQFPQVPLARFDRDSVQRRGELESLLEDMRSGRTRILVGTQMLTKGHHFPDVTMVGVVNADQGLFGTDFRASERLAQTIVQVAGRAGRAERRGEVMIQTEYPEHPLLTRLVTRGYEDFAEAALAERRASAWPPFASLALLRAEAPRSETARAWLESAARAARTRAGRTVRVLGPAPAPMARRAGRFRAQLLLQSAQRQDLQTLLAGLAPKLERLPGTRRVRWSLDVDPVELF